MKNIATPTAHIGCLVFLCLTACSDEVDRRDELGIEEEDNGRYELVAVEGQRGDSDERPNSLHNNSVAKIGSTSVQVAEPVVVQTRETEEVDKAHPQPEIDISEAVVFEPRGAYTVQIGGYRDAVKAKRLVRELKDAGYPAYAIARPGSKEMRVRIGYFKTQVDADRFGGIFKADRDMEYWVDKRENE